jgi:hypothetical protein
MNARRGTAHDDDAENIASLAFSALRAVARRRKNASRLS